MKTFAAVVTLGLVAAAQAQDQCVALASKIPTCAVSCIASALPDTGCSQADLACQCKPDNQQKLNAKAIGCIAKGCNGQLLQVQAAASSVCECVATAGGAGAAPQTSAAAPKPTAAGPASSEAQVTGTAGATGKSATGSATSSSTASATAGVTTTSSGGTSPTSSSASFTGAAVKAVAPVGGIIGGLIALIAGL